MSEIDRLTITPALAEVIANAIERIDRNTIPSIPDRLDISSVAASIGGTAMEGDGTIIIKISGPNRPPTPAPR